MAEADDIAKQVDSIYKGLLEKFHPAARQLISSGKAYLKALHGASASGRLYFESLQKVAQLSSRTDQGAPLDIGESLQQLGGVYRDLQAQELTLLRAFYVDLIVPLETNIEKDVKLLQGELKSFTSGHKQRKDAHSKAVAAVKKNRKKGRARTTGLDKQIKHYQALEETKGRLDAYLTQALQAAVLQERRRAGFVLERHCSLSRHHLALHTKGASLLKESMDTWTTVSASRDLPPEGSSSCLPYADESEEAIYSTPSMELCDLGSRVRRSRSVDLSCLGEGQDLYQNSEQGGPSLQRRRGSPVARRHESPLPKGFGPPLALRRHESPLLRRHESLPRTVDDGHLDTACSEGRELSTSSSSSSAAHRPAKGGRRAMTRALYKFTSSAGTQLSFQEGDTILIIGERTDGWQYGENTRTDRRGWFPVAYTESTEEDGADSAIGPIGKNHLHDHQSISGGTLSSWRSGNTSDSGSSNTITSVGTVRAAHAPSTAIGSAAPRAPKTSAESCTNTGPYNPTHPSLTANIFNTIHVSSNKKRNNSMCKDRYNDLDKKDGKYIDSDKYNSSTDKYTLSDNYSSGNKTLPSEPDSGSDTSVSLSCSLPGLDSSTSSSSQRGRVSFHSSNDSGFSNDGSRPTQPTVDYSDADTYRNRCLDSSFASSDTEPLTYFPTRIQGRACSLGRCDDHLFYRRENWRCKDMKCDCNSAHNKQNATLSPSAKRILAQRNSKTSQKKGKSSLRRSKSLLCLGMNSCRGVPDDLMSNDYEEMFATDWYHRSLIDVSKDIPAPPKHEPPTPPCAECMTSSCNTSCTYCSTEGDLENSYRDFSQSEHSMPNRVAMKPCKTKKRPPMPLPIEATRTEGRRLDNSPHVPPPIVTTLNSGKTNDTSTSDKRSTSIDSRRESRSNIMSKSIIRLSRSLTWASPKTNQQQNNKQTYIYESNKTAHNNYLNAMKNNQHNSMEKPSANQIMTIEECPKTPPLPPRKNKKNVRPVESPPLPPPVNMLTYADFIARRLRYPEGTSVLDQVSNNGRHMCGKWYDLWDESTSCTQI